MKRLETPLKPVSQSTDGDVPEDACADDQQRERVKHIGANPLAQILISAIPISANERMRNDHMRNNMRNL